MVTAAAPVKYDKQYVTRAKKKILLAKRKVQITEVASNNTFCRLKGTVPRDFLNLVFRKSAPSETLISKQK